MVRLRNQSVHLMPFLGGLIAPNNRWYAQGFMQFDFDSNGNSVDMNLYGNGLRKAGVANDSTYMYLDLGIGYWIYRNTNPGSFLSGIAPTVEMHYNRSLQNSDVVQNGLFQVGSYQGGRASSQRPRRGFDPPQAKLDAHGGLCHPDRKRGRPIVRRRSPRVVQLVLRPVRGHGHQPAVADDGPV